ncbi:MAG: tetratricopeptide repeat protein [Proteobacteria bacterium]|nr:tetratricopeptide repeat protein [Pseudomonadota bacterium]
MRMPAGVLICAALWLALMAAPPGTAGTDAAQDAFKRARAALARGDGIAAQAELQKAQAAGASRNSISVSMGEALIIQRDYDGARQWLVPAQFGPGDEAQGWRTLGVLERLTGNTAAAGQAFDRARTLAPKDPLIWVEIGRFNYASDDQMAAIAAANHALELDPDNVPALEFRAQLLGDQAGYDAAIPLYERAILHAPNDLAVLGGYAATLGEAGRARDMLVVTRHMIDLDPGDPQAWYLQAVLAARAGNVDLARRLAARTKARMDDRPAMLLLRGTLELEAGNANLAFAPLDRLIRMQPSNPRVQMLLARAMYEAGDTDGLLLRFSGLAARADASPYLLTLLARAQEERGDRIAAATLLDRAAAARTAPTMAIMNDGSTGIAAQVRSLISAGNGAGASGAAGRYLAQHSGSFEAQSLAGDAALAHGDAARALTYYRGAQRIRIPDRMVLRMVEALERTGQGRSAPGYVSSYLAAFPGSRLGLRLAAGHLAFAGDWANARSLLEGLRQRGGNRDARLLADLSLAQLRTGDTEAAEDTARRAAQIMPGSGVAAQAWGMALAAQDRDPDLARQLLTKAQQIDGDNPLLAEARKQLGK